MGVTCQPRVTDTRKMKSLTSCLFIAAITAQISAWESGPKAEECPCEIFKVVGSGQVAKLSMGGEYQKMYNSSGNRLGNNGAIWRQVKNGKDNAIIGTSSWGGPDWSIGKWRGTRKNIKKEIMAKLPKCTNWVWRHDTGRKCEDPKICPAGPQLKNKWRHKPKESYRWVDADASNTVTVTCKKYERKMKIFVRLLNNKKVILDVMSANSIQNVKDMIQKKEGYSTDQRKLKYGSKQLEDDKSLSYYNIKNRSTLYLIKE